MRGGIYVLKGVYLSIWSACLIAWAIVFLNFVFGITFRGCGQMHGVTLFACDLLESSINHILIAGLVMLPVMSLVAMVRFMWYRRCGRLELCLIVSSLALSGLSATHFTSY